jgi:hypothetical protein
MNRWTVAALGARGIDMLLMRYEMIVRGQPAFGTYYFLLKRYEVEK